MSLLLVPNHLEGEILRDGHKQRPICRVDRDTSITLGRNSTTIIADQRLARKECILKWKDPGKLEITRIHSSVWINGKSTVAAVGVLLGPGDELAFANRSYSYTIETIEARQASRKRKTPACLDIPREALDELHCSVCLDLIVHATALVPCGHVFCEECCQDVCPLCTSNVSTTVPCRPVSNLVFALLEQFSEDDVGAYRKRMGISTTQDSNVVPTRSTKSRAASDVVCRE